MNWGNYKVTTETLNKAIKLKREIDQLGIQMSNVKHMGACENEITIKGGDNKVKVIDKELIKMVTYT